MEETVRVRRQHLTNDDIKIYIKRNRIQQREINQAIKMDIYDDKQMREFDNVDNVEEAEKYIDILLHMSVCRKCEYMAEKAEYEFQRE